MKMYHYVAKGNNVLEKGLLSLAANPNADLAYYYRRSGAQDYEGIVRWMESCFSGRSRSIRCFTETIKWHNRCLNLKRFIENADLFSFDIEALVKDGLLDAVYVSPSILDVPDIDEETCCDELLFPLSSYKDIDFSPVDWSVCDEKLGRRFAYVRYYLAIVKGGVIPPQYLTLEK